MKISKIVAREILDSRGNPTVECTLTVTDGRFVTSSVPSGASTGKYEAHELRDGGKRFGGRGVTKAIDKIETEIAPALIGKEVDAFLLDQLMIELDGTPNKKKLGANATLAVSMALYRAQAMVEGAELFEFLAWISGMETLSLPVPHFNLINGGAHAENDLRIQEFMVVPVGARDFAHAVQASIELFAELKALLKKKGKFIAVGDEGGFASNFKDDREALNYLMEATASYTEREEIVFAFALDVAASQFYNKKTKLYEFPNKKRSSDEMISWYKDLGKKFPIYSIEDGLDEDDWAGWAAMTQELGENIQLVGDDLYATSLKRIVKGLEQGAGNAVLIKPNQVGTISQTLQAIALCKEQNLGTIISHRSGETNDTFIADIAVGTSSGQIKAGGPCRGERIAKYNRLLEIEDILVRRLMSK